MTSSTTTEERPGPTTPRAPRHALWIKIVILALVAAVLTGTGIEFRMLRVGHPDDPNRAVPVSAAMQQKLGVRFSRVAVVADGGLITLFYVVLDPEKASRFQSDVTHPPVLTSESRALSTHRVSLMKQGHSLRAGQTYYLVYENSRRALRPGEQVTISYGRLRLEHVPVL